MGSPRMTPPQSPQKRRKNWLRFQGLAFLCVVLLIINSLFEDITPQRQTTETNTDDVEKGLLTALAALEGMSYEDLQDAVFTAKANMEFKKDEGRPKMYTFFHQLDHSHAGQKTGMTFEADHELLEAWKEAWYDAGWEPTILTLNDAVKHPDFQEFNSTLHNHMPFGEYDVLCFLRHLAMVEAGGGWMSDYDVFPLNPLKDGGHNHALPNGGRFTAYEKQRVGPGAVPSLVSGTAKEWNRMAHNIYENAIQHKQENFWSDFFAIIDLDKQMPGLYEIENAVVYGRDVLTGQHWGPGACKITDGKLAVHFAHDAISRGHLRPGETQADRPKIATHWRNMWKERCEPVPFENISTKTFRKLKRGRVGRSMAEKRKQKNA